jgi:hypothetical protein
LDKSFIIRDDLLYLEPRFNFYVGAKLLFPATKFLGRNFVARFYLIDLTRCLDVQLQVHPGQSQEPGWLGGELDGKVGWFPEAYVEKMEAEVPRKMDPSF